MDNSQNMNAKGKGFIGWIIAIILLVVILLLVTLIPRSAAGPNNANENRMIEQESQSQMQESDDVQSIQQDIDANLETEFQF